MATTFLKINNELSLQIPNPDWAADLFDIVNQQRPYLQQWLNWVKNAQEVEDVRKILREERAFSQYGQKLCTYIFKEDQLLGAVAFTRFAPKHHRAEMGYWLRQDFQGQGIMTQACQRLIQYGFDHKKLHRIEMKITRRNEKSQALAQKLGFQLEGQLREAIYDHKVFDDLLLYGRLKKD